MGKKRKILSFIGMIVLLVSLTGCIKFNATMDIKEDKSMDFSIIYAMNKKFLEMSDEPQELMKEEDKQKLIDEGYTITDYEDDTNKGFTIVKHINNIDDYSSEVDTTYSISGLFEESKDTKMFKVIKGTDKNTYIADFKFDSSDSTLAGDDATDTQTETQPDGDVNDTTNVEGDLGDLSKMGDAMASSMDLKFMVKLPYAAISNNATGTSEDLKELTWTLNTENTENIQFQFELNNTNTTSPTNSQSASNSKTSGIDLSMIIAIISLVVGIASLVIVLIVVKGKNSKPTEM